MKTDKFEKIIRRKLESITPDFQEGDWTKMQNYMHARTPPTFWQQYSSWLGYAAAASVTSVMAFMYVNQLSQNNHLLSDVKQLQNQIEVIKNNPAVVQKTDTVYLVQQQSADQQNIGNSSQNHREERFIPQPYENNVQGSLAGNATDIKPSSVQPSGDLVTAQFSANGAGTEQNEKRDVRANAVSVASSGKTHDMADIHSIVVNEDNASAIPDNLNNRGNKGGDNAVSGNDYAAFKNSTAPGTPQKQVILTRTLDEGFDQMETQTPVQANSYHTVSRSMRYSLAQRIAPKQVKSGLLATNSPVVHAPESQKNVASTKKAATTIPRLNLKVPYRFGFAQQWEGKNQARTIVAEVVVSKHFSFSTGLSWLKVKAQQFYSEKSYRDKTQKNFREEYKPNAIPFERIENISIKPSVVQIPLTIAYRNDLKNNFTYFISAGTNFTVNQEQDITFDCYRDIYIQTSPKPYIVRAIRSEQTTEKMHLNLVNSMNFSAGIEKSWHPVVLQAEGYLFTYFSPLSPQMSRSGPGFKIKLLYQIGKKM
jgi:hypothetical protein